MIQTMIATDATAPIAPPPVPKDLAETGVNFDLMLQLVAKSLFFAGELLGTDLAAKLGVEFPAIEPCLDLLKRDRHCEISGGALLGAPLYRYRLTDAGRSRAALFFDQNQYVGKVPVPIEQYRRYMAEVGRAAPLVTR